MAHVSRLFAGLWLASCLAVLAGGCGSRSAAPPADVPAAPPIEAPDAPSAPPDAAPALPADAEAKSGDAAECQVAADAGEPISTVALTEPVDPAHVPHPANDSERIVFRHLYETLVRVDCEGRIRPGLAASWERGVDGRTWHLTLREDARFSDATAVTAAEIHASLAPASECTLPQPGCAVESLALTDGALTIVLRQAADDLRVLADTRLAIVKRTSGNAWPLGTRGLAVAATGSSGRGEVTLTRTLAGASRDGAAPLQFLVDRDGDPRDFLDRGVDLLLTRDPRTLDYAATLPRYAPVSLDWRRTRVFVSRWRTASNGTLPLDARQALAADAVRGDSRGAEGPFWWQGLTSCDAVATAPGAAPSEGPSGRIVYAQDDPASRDLAERLVGLAAIRQPPAVSIVETLLPGDPRRLYQRALPLTGDAFATALTRGADSGFIASFTRLAVNPCGEWRSVAARVPWLEPEAIVPLVDTRAWAIVARGRSGLTAEWDGGLLVTAAGSGR